MECSTTELPQRAGDRACGAPGPKRAACRMPFPAKQASAGLPFAAPPRTP